MIIGNDRIYQEANRGNREHEMLLKAEPMVAAEAESMIAAEVEPVKVMLPCHPNQA